MQSFDISQGGNRRNKALLLLATCPGMRQVDVARQVGLSKERVRQLAMKYRLRVPRVVMPWPTCAFCGEPVRKRGNKHCSVQCWNLARKADTLKRSLHYVCETCGEEFIVAPSDVKQRKGRFCSHQCWGSYAGKTWGWGAKRWGEIARGLPEDCPLTNG